jgi:lipoprotein
MKKTAMVLMLLSLVLVAGCGEDSKVKKAVTDYAKEWSSTDNAKVDFIYTTLDTVPYYLMAEVRDKWKEYEERKGSIYASSESIEKAMQELQRVYREKKENGTVAHISYVKVSFDTPFGPINEGLIVLNDKDNPEKRLGSFTTDLEFRNKYMRMKNVLEGYEFKKNEFGKLELDDNLPELEKYIME